MEKIKGRVIKGLGGIYEVLCDTEGEKSIVSCRARGNIRRTDDKLFVGDIVTVSTDKDGSVIESVFERRNSLIRPPLSNIDYLFITLATEKPAPILSTIDKMTAIAVHNKITPVIIITKSDCSDACDEYRRIYESAGFDTLVCSSLSGEGIEKVKKFVFSHLTDGKTGAFAGASGVGKSTLMNRIFPSLSLETGDVSKKIGRGRHTTRHVQLYEIDNGGFLADTPGFSLLDFERFDFFELSDLFAAFPDLYEYNGRCQYADCTHTGERECEITRAAREKKIAPSRRESYLELYRVLKEKKPYK